MFSSNGRYLEKLLKQFDIDVNLDLPDCPRHLVNDSRVVKTHDIFCAVKGTLTQGNQYINAAIENGCDLVLAESLATDEHGKFSEVSFAGKTVQQVTFYRLNQRLFSLAQAFYQNPQAQLNIIGVTGTNGKTSTSQMIAQLLQANNQCCAVIGTNGAGNLENLVPITNTTPGATELHQLLTSFSDNKNRHVAMEVSSHALEQKRVQSSLFDIAVFTNLSRDHLDYHHTLANYADAKYQLFSQTGDQVAVINGDDSQAKQWLLNWSNEQSVVVYGCCEAIVTNRYYLQASDIEHHQQGLSFTLNTHLGSTKLNCALIGDFNIYNLLAAIAVLLIEKVCLSDIADAVAMLKPVIGRMEVFSAPDKATVIVDYAHTPDALENALNACRQHCQGQLWLVFGCGGDRDKGKRAQMGEIAAQLSDHVVVTNDNPRHELAEDIAQDILSGCQQTEHVALMLDRQQAVLTTLKQAKAKDIVLLAGKGHEDYILFGDTKLPYNERELVRSTYASYANEVSL